jgi:hypothetical protein
MTREVLVFEIYVGELSVLSKNLSLRSGMEHKHYEIFAHASTKLRKLPARLDIQTMPSKIVF